MSQPKAVQLIAHVLRSQRPEPLDFMDVGKYRTRNRGWRLLVLAFRRDLDARYRTFEPMEFWHLCGYLP